MPLYSIQGPDGRTYSIEGPPGATREQVIQAIQARMQDTPQTVTAPPVPQPEQSGFFRQVLDVPVQVSRGMVGGIRMLADVFGSGSSASEALKSADTWLADLLSAQAKNDQRQVAQILKDAEDKGVLDQVKAGFQAFLTAPVDTLSQALGSTAPVVIAGLASGPVGAVLGTARLGAVAMPAVGAAMGVGEVKGSIYESVKEAYKQKGASDEVAEAKAQEAQAYSSANLPSMAVAGGLGALAGGMGIEKPLAGMLSRRTAAEMAERQALAEAERGVASRVGLGALREGAPEFAQAGQSKLAENIALRNEGFDVPLFQGVFGAAAMEGAAGAVLGGGLSAPRPAGNLLPGQKVGESDADFARRLSREIDAARQREQIPNPLTQPIAEPTAPTVVPAGTEGEDLYRLPDGTAGTLDQAKAYAMSVPPEQRMAVLQQIQSSKITKEQAAPEDLFTQPAGEKPEEKPAEEVKPTEELKPAEEKPEEKPVESAQAVTKEEEEAAQDALQAEKKPEQSAMSGLPVIEAPLSELILSKDVPQFKSDADTKGVVEPLGGTFDRRGVAPIQVWKRNDGRMEVISGRHRLDLARRSGETTIPAQIHEEATGFDAKQAAMLDAELNIRDQQGKVKDYVAYFENAGISEADAESRGLLARAPGKQGFAIATKGSPELVAAHRADVIPDAGAAAIANSAPGDSRLQAVGIKAIQEGKSPLAAVNLIKAVQTISKDQPPSEGGDLFGFDDSAMREAEDMAKIATLKQNQLAQRLAAISGASRRPEIAKKEGIDIKDPEALKKREKELRQQKAAWDNWPSSPELVQEIRQEMAPKAPEEAKPSVREAPAAKEPSPELQAKIDLLGKALTRIMSRYGLKDVALKLVADMKAEGEYSSKVLSLALDATDPVSALRHESIHAMKELGFFSDQQWKSLERQAKEKWINQYLKQKNVNRQPLQEGQTSRYDAYMRLYGGDEEAVIEEAIADAFADFDSTKAPPGMLQALLKKIQNFFQAIKEAFGAEPDAERIFRKAERGGLRGREVDPNLWKETTEEKADAEAYEEQNDILPYTSAGQIDVPVETPKASIKAPYAERELAKGKENHPILGVPLNANGTVTLYFPTNNASAREVAKTKRLKAVNPTANRIYLTNESNPAAVRGRLGNIDQGPVEANVMVQVPPELLQLDMEHEDGRKDFFIQLAEGNAFAEKMKLTKLFTLYKPRSEAISKTTTLSDIGKGLKSGIAAYRKMSPDKRKARLAQARQVLKDEHNVGTLLGENGKLQKTRLNEYQLPEDIKNSVASLGLGLASAQKINERNLSTCPNSARCEGLCLGETSGQNQLYGGDGPFRAGPRLSQYLKTEALVMHPEDFGIVLYEEIKRFEAWSRSQRGFEYITNDAGEKVQVKKQVYTPAIRLNVTSDFPPKMWKPLIEGFPRVRFYDYTKLATPGPIANNHHLTYSSDGVAQVVEGKTVGLGSNWDAMIKRLNGGFNVAMAFTSKRDMPNFVQDEKTGDRFQVWNGDNYDARFLDPRPGQKENLFKKGMIIGLTNKDRTGRPEDAAIRHDGFFVDYDRERDGDTVVIRDQEKIKQGKKVIPIAKPRFSLRDKLGMYSELENKIEAGSNKAPADSWKAYINGLTQKGVKPEEIEWSGVKDWLDLQKGTVTKEELLNYLKQGGVRVEETLLSDDIKPSFEIDDFIEEMAKKYGHDAIYSTDGNYSYVKNTFPWMLSKEDQERYEEVRLRTQAERDAQRALRPKYDQYTLPGGENYREVLLTLPRGRMDSSFLTVKETGRASKPWGLFAQGEDVARYAYNTRAEAEEKRAKYVQLAPVKYQSSHWDQPNVLAHIRVNDRTDADGKRVLFVEELQSDWGQEGKKKGFHLTPAQIRDLRPGSPEAIAALARGDLGVMRPVVEDGFGRQMTMEIAPEKTLEGIAPAPFVTKTEGWLNLALKRIMVMAAEGGYDKVAFVNGEQSAERYDLSKQVDSITYEPTSKGYYINVMAGGQNIKNGDFTTAELEDIVGKEIVQKMEAREGKQEFDPEVEPDLAETRSLSGLDLKVGGEGMKTFYDTIVPTAVKKLLPKVGGGQMEMVDVQVPPASAMYPDKTTLRETIQQSGFDVTPAMRNKVQTTGLPRFSLRDTVNVDGTERPATSSTNKPIYPTEEGTKNFWRWFKDSAVVDDEDRPLVVYRGVDTDYGTTARVSKEGALGAGIYTTPSASFASSYAEGEAPNVMPLYVSLQKPLLLKHKGNEDPMIMALVQLGMKQDKAEAMVEKAYEEKGYIGKQVMNRALSQGYDGLMQYRDGKLTEIVAFNPTQIKSAIGNVGKFDPVEPSIKASLRDATDPVTRARIDQITTPREEKSFIKRITEAIAPKSASSFRAAFLDRYNRLSEYDKELVLLMGGAPLLADASSHSAALMSDMSAGVLAGAMGVHDGVGGIPVYVNGHTKIVNNNNTVKGPIAIFAPLAKYNDPFIYQKYQFWAAVNRGLRLYAQGRDPKMITPADQAEAAKILVDHPEFADIQKEWIKFNDGLVQYLKDTGVLTEAAAKEFVKYADYIPFYRQADGEETVGPQIFASLSGVRAPKKLKGSEVPLGEFLETVVRNVQYSIEAGMKNVAAQRAVNTAVAIGQANRLNYVSSAPNVVKVLENGKTSYYETKDMLFVEAMKSLNLGDLPFIGLLAGPANLLRNLVTKDPAFMLANMMRDSMSAWVSSGVKMTPMVDTLTNFTKALRGQNPEYEALLNSGVIGGYDYSQGVEISARLFDRALRKKAGVYTPAEQLARPFVSLWDALEKGTTASDAATRMEIYKKTLAATGNEAEALFRAVEVMNFNRKGNNPMIRVLTAAVPFLNARMQGLDVLYRAAFAKGSNIDSKEIQRRFFVRGMTIAALSTMYWMLASEDDEWKKQEQETRDNYWIFPSLGVKIPIPFEIGVLFKVIPERILEYSFGDDTGKDFLKSMTRQLMGTLAFNPIPQTVLPAIESVTNFSFFTMRPIVSQGLEDVNPAYQIGPTTSRLGELIGGATRDLPTALQISPTKVDALIRGYTGTLGGYMVDLFDAIYDMNSDAPKAAKRFEQMPVIRRFAVDPQARGQVTAYYELKNAVDEAVRTSNLLERNMQPQQWGEYFEENKGLFAIKDYILDLEKSMKQYREMKNFVRASSMDADQKKDIILNIITLENQLASNIQEIKKMSSGQ